jgi:phosphatidylglycerol:prolipoprotein diacylglycerol transferase
MAPILSILGIAIQTYPLAILLAAGVGLWLSSYAARKLGQDGNAIYDLGFYAFLAATLGARLSYVVAHLDAYWEAPLSVLSLTPTALYWPGGAGIGGVFAAVYWRRHRLPVGPTLDALTLGLAPGLAIERLGAFLGGQGLGIPTGLPWGVYLGEQTRHPVQLYEMGALLIVAGLLWHHVLQRPFSGQRFTLFLALYAGVRLFSTAFHAETPHLDNGLRVAQLVALSLMMGAVGYLYYRQFAPATGKNGDS